MKSASTALSLICAFAVVASAQTIHLSHSMDDTTILAGNSIACTSVTGDVLATSYWRRYTPASFGVTQMCTIVSVSFGIEFASSPSGFQPALIRIYKDTTPPNIGPASSLQLLTTQAMTIADTGMSGPRIDTVNLVPTVAVLPSDALVIEIDVPATTMTNPGVTFFLGSNSAGETDATFISSVPCFITTPVTAGSLGATGMHAIIDIDVVPATLPAYPGTNEDLVMEQSVNLGPIAGGAGFDVVAVNPLDFITMRCDSMGGTFYYAPLILGGQIFNTGFPYPSAFPGLHLSPLVAFPIAGFGATPVPFSLLPPGGFAISAQIPASVGGFGLSFLAQFLIVSPIAQNGIFVATDAIEFRIP